MRELALAQIQDAINDGDDEIEDTYGEFSVIEKMTDAEVLDVFAFLHCFRG